MIPNTSRSLFYFNQNNGDQNSRFVLTKLSKKMVPVKPKNGDFSRNNRQGIVNYPSFPSINSLEFLKEPSKFFDQRGGQWKDKNMQNHQNIHRSFNPLIKVKNDSEVDMRNAKRRIQHRMSNRSNMSTERKETVRRLNNSINENHSPASRNDVSSGIRMTPHSVLRHYRSQLTSLEQEEIFDYQDIWFLGLHAIKTEAIRGASPNNGYDDDTGAYIKISHDHLAFRYEALETLGKGSFGQVVRAIDHQTGQEVALKIIRNKKRFHQQAQIEVSILNHLKRKERFSEKTLNIIKILDHFEFRNHPCIVFELFGENLYDVIKRNNFRGFSLAAVQKMAYELFICLQVLRRENIIHCDIKPENILIRSKSCLDIKLIDFGSSCYSDKRVYTYIQSRFYRCPEVILGIPYTTQIDLWSLGCVLPELITGRPIFPGENEMDQLACVIEVFGYPPKGLMEESTRKNLFFDNKGEARSLTNSKGKRRIPKSNTLQSTMKVQTDPKFVDLISQCLEWDPKKRITPEAALEHPWFYDFKAESNTPYDSITSEFKNSSRRSINKDYLKGKEKLGPHSQLIKHRLDKENLPPLITKKEKKECDIIAINERIEFPSLYR